MNCLKYQPKCLFMLPRLTGAILLILASLTYPQNKTAVQFNSMNGWTSTPGDENWDDRFGPSDDLDDYDEHVRAVAVVDSEIYIGGFFWTKDAKYWNNIARWNGDRWSSLGRGVQGQVFSLAIIGDDLYVGGTFAMVDSSILAQNIAKWNRSTQHWAALEPSGFDGFGRTVYSLLPQGNELYVAVYSIINGAGISQVAKWNSSINTWTIFEGDIDGSIRTLAVSGTEVYIGGYFTSAGSVMANNIAKWNGREWAALGSGVNGAVSGIASLGNDVYVAGLFSKAGGVKANKIVKWNTLDEKWADVGTIPFNESPVYGISALAAGNGCVYVSGPMDLIANIPGNLAKWDPINATWSPLGSGLGGGGVYTITTKANDVYVGGYFKTVGGKPSTCFAIWHEPDIRSNSAPLITSSLPQITFKEDSTLLYSRTKWFNRVQDREDADSLLVFAVLSGKRVTATRQGSNYRFTAPSNWFGRDTLTLIVSDRGQLADTAEFVVRVRAVNDAPVLGGLPATLKLKTAETLELPLWEFVSDVDHPDSTLHFSFSASNDSLRREFNHKTGQLTLAAPDFNGTADLFITVQDDSGATARDTVAVHIDQTTGVVEQKIEIPTEFALLQNYPNPFNPATVIRFALPQAAEVKLEVYDLAGRRVALLLDGRKPAGYHQIEFRATELPSAVYFYRLSTEGITAIKKLMLLR